MQIKEKKWVESFIVTLSVVERLNIEDNRARHVGAVLQLS